MNDRMARWAEPGDIERPSIIPVVTFQITSLLKAPGTVWWLLDQPPLQCIIQYSPCPMFLGCEELVCPLPRDSECPTDLGWATVWPTVHSRQPRETGISFRQEQPPPLFDLCLSTCFRPCFPLFSADSSFCMTRQDHIREVTGVIPPVVMPTAETTCIGDLFTLANMTTQDFFIHHRGSVGVSFTSVKRENLCKCTQFRDIEENTLTFVAGGC